MSDATAETPSSSGATARGALLLAVILLPALFWRLGACGLWDPDEGRYAEIPREMLARGDFVTPTLNGVVYFEKPPLLYWSVAGAFRVLGETEFAGRLVPALAATLGVLLAWRLGRRMFGERAGLLGAVVLATSLMWAILGRFLVIDTLFSTLVFAALAAFWIGHEARGRRAWTAHAGFWIALALAVLAKGPVALVLVGGTIGLYLLVARRWSCLASGALWGTAPLLPLVAAPWFVLVSLRNPGFDRFFWYEQNVGRFLGLPGAEQHSAGALYFVQFLPALFFPWSGLALVAAAADGRALLAADGARRRAALFLLGGALFTFAFFSASDGKLLPYVEPALPLLAVALGGWLDAQLARGAAGRGRLALGAGLAAAAMLAAAAGLLVRGPAALAEYEQRGPALALLLAAPLAVGGAAVLVALARGRGALALGLLAGSVALLVADLASGVAIVGPNHSCRQLVQDVRPGLDAGAELVVYDAYLPGLNFYSQRRLHLNGGQGELDFGYAQLPDAERVAWYADDLAVFARRLADARPTYAVVRDHETALALLPRLPDGVREIAWNERRSILGNAAAAALTPPVGHVGVPEVAP